MIKLNSIIDQLDNDNYCTDIDNGIIALEDVGIELEELEGDMGALIEEIDEYIL